MGLSSTKAAEPSGIFSLTQEEDGITINIDGELFTRYLTKSGPRSVLWPVIGPTGKAMTRAYPVGEGDAKEAEDHVHHRSLWIGYEGVNELDFWHEPATGPKAYPKGEQRHRQFDRFESSGDTAMIVATTDWLGPDEQKICEDQRTWTFGTDGEDRWLDCRMVLTASETDLRLADSKEGFFAVRVADSMNVDHKQGGRIVNSRGLTDAAAWAQPAEWVDYQGPVAGEKVGIAIFAHPESLNYPAPWHVRTYGLFAGNPLGKVAFIDGAGDIRDRPPRMTLSKGESLVLHYRVVLHRGDEKEAKLAEKYAEYIKEKE
ncbi:MAG: PmoA family protein [Bythopirellula sp.]|nr:PmoA family protein [Bythopirellula sp.]